MKNKIINSLFIASLILYTNALKAQMYRAATTDALENNGREWVQTKLPPSIITFSDYFGQVDIKVPISSLFEQNPDSTISAQTPIDTMADFTMNIDKEQIEHQQITNGKTFSTSGNLVINGIKKKTEAQYVLIPRNNPSDGFNISVSIRFNPADYGMKINGEPEDTPLIVRVTSNLNKYQYNNF